MYTALPGKVKLEGAEVRSGSCVLLEPSQAPRR